MEQHDHPHARMPMRRRTQVEKQESDDGKAAHHPSSSSSSTSLLRRGLRPVRESSSSSSFAPSTGLPFGTPSDLSPSSSSSTLLSTAAVISEIWQHNNNMDHGSDDDDDDDDEDGECQEDDEVDDYVDEDGEGAMSQHHHLHHQSTSNSSTEREPLDSGITSSLGIGTGSRDVADEDGEGDEDDESGDYAVDEDYDEEDEDGEDDEQPLMSHATSLTSQSSNSSMEHKNTDASTSSTNTSALSTTNNTSTTSSSTSSSGGEGASNVTLGVRRYRDDDSSNGSSSNDAPSAKRLKPSSYSALRLAKEFANLSKNSPPGIIVGLIDDDLYQWTVLLEGPKDTIFEGGMFKCELTFPSDYPAKPPVMQFKTPGFFHPNVFGDGHVCISILHAPVVDRYNPHEPLSEKWRPVLGVEQVLISVMSMLCEPNCDSPANVEASNMFKHDYPNYKKRVRQVVRRSQEEF